MGVASLQWRARVCVARLVMRTEGCSDVAPVYRYLLPLAAHLLQIAHMCHYYKSPKLTELFLPILVAKGRLFINNTNIKKVLSYWNTSSSGCDDSQSSDGLSDVASVTHVKVDDIEGRQYFDFLPFVGHLRRLKYLEVTSFVDNELLCVLGVNCPELVVFDAREETANAITDVGLSYLAQCKKMKKIYLSFSDEYDCPLDQPGYSEKGIALLLISLPELEHLQCSEYLLRDALCFIYQSNYCKKKLPVRCMLMEHPEVNGFALRLLPILCPQLEVLALIADSGNEELIGNTVRTLPRLKVLLLTLGSGYKLDLLNFPSYGHQITYLQITTSLLDSQNILLLSHYCVNLKTLILKMHSFGYDGIASKTPLFPSVEKLELQQSISVRLFSSLCVGMTNVREVHCPWATVHGIQDAVISIINQGAWINVELLVLPIVCTISLPIAKLIVSSLPKLSRVGVSVAPADDQELSVYVRTHQPQVTRTDPDLVLSPSKSGMFAQTSWSGEMQPEYTCN